MILERRRLRSLECGWIKGVLLFLDDDDDDDVLIAFLSMLEWVWEEATCEQFETHLKLPKRQRWQMRKARFQFAHENHPQIP